MDIQNMIQTFIKHGIVVRPDSSPIIQALRDMENNGWRMRRQLSMSAIERSYRKQHTTPQRLITRIREYGSDKFSKKDNIMMGIWNWLDGDLKAEEEYQEAVKAGATEIIIPLETGETGIFLLECPCEMDFEGQAGDKIARIELTIFEHNAWTCPRCGRFWALRNMACVDVEGNDDKS